MKDDNYVSGSPCVINKCGDMYIECEARPFFDVPCIIVKRTKSGLIQVALWENKNKVYSFPQRNVDLL